MEYIDVLGWVKTPEEKKAYKDGKQEVLLKINNMLNSTKGMYENIKEYVDEEIANTED
jgi:glutaredoxin 2